MLIYQSDQPIASGRRFSPVMIDVVNRVIIHHSIKNGKKNQPLAALNNLVI
jgi:hypothetical protein